MESARLKELYDLVISEQANPEEYQEMKALMALPEYEDQARELISMAYDQSKELQDIDQQTRNEILEAIFQADRQNVRFLPGIVKNKWLAIAASLVLMVSIGTYLLITRYNSLVQTASVYKSDVNPGTNKAVLTLANGSTINLNSAANGLISTQQGATVIKRSNGQLEYITQKSSENVIATVYNTLSTPAGGQYQVNLPDGSKVWLNASSSLRYPSTFSHLKNRSVELSGEGYFEVQKDKLHPFIITSGVHQVQVLGTHFNISSYSDDNAIKTTLIEGSVKVTVLHDQKSLVQILKPGQQSDYSGNVLKVANVDTDDAIAWHMGYFVFHRESLENIMKEVSRWYDVPVVYQSNEVKYIPFSGTVSRFGKASELLKVLELTNKVKFKIYDHKIFVSQ
jgi:transmembrane sensor